MIVRNREELTSHGNIDGRKTVLDIIEAGFTAADPYENTRRLIRIKDGKLIVGHKDLSQPPGLEPLIFDLSEVRNIYVTGGGKAAQRQAKAIEDVLGDLITEGHVNAKKGEKVELKRIEVTLAGHPIPDEDSVKGSRRIYEIETKARKGDIVFFSESGGGSALMALPGPGISLEDLQEVTQMLYFECGSSMPEINAVRWQLMILRGRHGRNVGDATLIGIHTDEVPPDPPPNPRKIGGITDAYQYAIEVLKRYEIWDEVPQSVRTYLLKADPRYDIIHSGELDGKPQYHFRVMGPEYMLNAARKKAEDLGVKAQIIAASLNDLETKDVAGVLAYMAREIELHGRPFKPPCILLCGGELVVTVGKATGIGGRNQEFALSTASIINGTKNIVVASADSDGTDGPSPAAGGLVDSHTTERALEAGIDVFEELGNHNSYEALKRLEDNIITGARGTNVRDLRVFYIGD